MPLSRPCLANGATSRNSLATTCLSTGNSMGIQAWSHSNLDRDAELAMRSACIACFGPARASLHVSTHIGSPAILPASVASKTIPRLDTVISGRDAASCSQATLASSSSGHASRCWPRNANTLQCPFTASIGRRIQRGSRPVGGNVPGSGVPSSRGQRVPR
jgi:hypothetical protein